MIDYPRFQHRALTRFADLAAGFCDLVDSAGSRDAAPFLRDLHLHLPRLYSAGLELPHTDVLYRHDDPTLAELEEPYSVSASSVAEPDPDRQTHEAWRDLVTRLGKLIGPLGAYRGVFDPFAPLDDAEVIGSLADDIADIYRDLSCGLRKWRRGETGEALWEWRFGLEHHWGEHVTGALRALFALSAWHDLGWPEAPG